MRTHSRDGIIAQAIKPLECITRATSVSTKARIIKKHEIDISNGRDCLHHLSESRPFNVSPGRNTFVSEDVDDGPAPLLAEFAAFPILRFQTISFLCLLISANAQIHNHAIGNADFDSLLNPAHARRSVQQYSTSVQLFVFCVLICGTLISRFKHLDTNNCQLSESISTVEHAIIDRPFSDNVAPPYRTVLEASCRPNRQRR
jgi:hypothetical protein